MIESVALAYWNLVYSIQNLGAMQESLKYARDLLFKNQKELEAGLISPVEILNAKAEVAGREAGRRGTTSFRAPHASTRLPGAARSAGAPPGGDHFFPDGSPTFSSISASRAAMATRRSKSRPLSSAPSTSSRLMSGSAISERVSGR